MIEALAWLPKIKAHETVACIFMMTDSLLTLRVVDKFSTCARWCSLTACFSCPSPVPSERVQTSLCFRHVRRLARVCLHECVRHSAHVLHSARQLESVPHIVSCRLLRMTAVSTLHSRRASLPRTFALFWNNSFATYSPMRLSSDVEMSLGNWNDLARILNGWRFFIEGVPAGPLGAARMSRSPKCKKVCKD